MCYDRFMAMRFVAVADFDRQLARVTKAKAP
jgi:hypothetical protein